MESAEVRGHLLRILYNRRLNAGGRVPVSDMELSSYGVASADVIISACEHLAEAGLIRWEPVAGRRQGVVVGIGLITGLGVDVIEGLAAPLLAVSLPRPGAALEAPEDHPLRGINPARLAAWEKHGVEAVEADLAYNNGLTYVGGPPEITGQAWRWVRFKKTRRQPQPPEILTLKPGIWGISVDLKALIQRVRRWRHTR